MQTDKVSKPSRIILETEGHEANIDCLLHIHDVPSKGSEETRSNEGGIWVHKAIVCHLVEVG